MQTTDIREDAKRLVENLPANSTWEDLMREIYVRQTIERGLEDSRQGRTTDVKEVRARYGLVP